MEISNDKGYLRQLSYVRNSQTGKPGTAASRKEKPGDGPDRVNISSEARIHQRAMDTLQATPDVREELVSDIRRQIREGSYEIDEEGIARKMILDALIHDTF